MRRAYVPRQKVHLRPGQRVRIRLNRGPDGCTQETSPSGGTEYQYIVDDDSGILWLPKEGREALLRSGARAGDEVYLTKHKRGNQIFFTAQVAEQAAAANERYAFRSTPPPPMPQREVRNPHASADAPTGSPSESPLFEQAVPEVPALRPGAESVAGYLYVAIDAAALATKYAQDRYHLALPFDTDQVRRLATVLMIGAQRSRAFDDRGEL